METILNFFTNNYIWFLVISLILLFALIGYFVDCKEKKASKIHFSENEDNFPTEEDANKKDDDSDNKLKTTTDNAEKKENKE